MHFGTFWNILHAFWNILHTFWNILHAFWNILHAFWNILHTLWNILHVFRNILEHSACILVHSGTFCIHSGTFWSFLHAFWNILEHSGTFWVHFECILERISTWDLDRHTDIRTCWAASSQLNIIFKNHSWFLYAHIVIHWSLRRAFNHILSSVTIMYPFLIFFCRVISLLKWKSKKGSSQPGYFSDSP